MPDPPPVGAPPTQPVLVNSLLSYMKFLMLSCGKTLIFDEICAKFDLDAIKCAREVAFNLLPDKNTDRYVYQGPNGVKSPREKSIHALEGVYAKMNTLDQTSCPVLFVCPSHDLSRFLKQSTLCDHKCDVDRFHKLETDVSNLKQLQTSYDDLKQTVRMLQSNLVLPSKPADVPPILNHPPASLRDRSDSVRSVKRNLSTDSMDADEINGGFRLTNTELKKIKRRKLSANYSGALLNGVPKPNAVIPKRQGTWGQSSNPSSDDFAGSVPDCFLYNCGTNTTVDGIIRNLGAKGITVKSAELKSPSDAATLSFRVILEKLEDFEKLMSGEHILKRMKVREFIHFKRRNNGKNQVNNTMKKPSYVYHPKPVNSAPNPHNVYQAAVNDLNKLLAQSNEVITPVIAPQSLPLNYSIDTLLTSNDLNCSVSQ